MYRIYRKMTIIFLYNLYIFWIHLKTVLYSKHVIMNSVIKRFVCTCLVSFFLTYNHFAMVLLGFKAETMLDNQSLYNPTKCVNYTENWPFLAIRPELCVYSTRPLKFKTTLPFGTVFARPKWLLYDHSISNIKTIPLIRPVFTGPKIVLIQELCCIYKQCRENCLVWFIRSRQATSQFPTHRVGKISLYLWGGERMWRS